MQSTCFSLRGTKWIWICLVVLLVGASLFFAGHVRADDPTATPTATATSTPEPWHVVFDFSVDSYTSSGWTPDSERWGDANAVYGSGMWGPVTRHSYYWYREVGLWLGAAAGHPWHLQRVLIYYDFTDTGAIGGGEMKVVPCSGDVMTYDHVPVEAYGYAQWLDYQAFGDGLCENGVGALKIWLSDARNDEYLGDVAIRRVEVWGYGDVPGPEATGTPTGTATDTLTPTITFTAGATYTAALGWMGTADRRAWCGTATMEVGFWIRR